jgi:hypothetical protein
MLFHRSFLSSSPISPEKRDRMAGRILHFGADTCHRLPVLENAGYTVERCTSLAALREALEDGEAPDALVMTETEKDSPREAVRLARAHSPIPLILFRETQRSLGEDGFDLVVPILHPPEAWLAEIAALIATSAQIRGRSAGFRAEAAQVPTKPGAERQRAAGECPPNAAPAKRRIGGPESGSENL